MRPTDKKIENLVQNLNDKTRPELDEKILAECLTELDNQKSIAPQKGPNVWNLIIHNNYTKYAAMVVFLLILAGAVAVKIMTPSERIEVMDELEKSHGQPAYDPDSHGEVSEEEKVTVAGIIKTWDGKKVTRRACMAIHYTRHQSSGTIGISPTFGPKAKNWVWDGDTGLFSHRNSYGIIYISVSSPGYAPACVGPYKLEPGQVKDDIEIVLEKGYPASIQIVDADTQQPVPDVELTGGYLFRPGGYHYTINLKTNENGIAVIKDAGNFNVTLRATATGYQQTNFKDQILLKNETIVLKMKKAEPAEGTVVSKATGQPISGAVIRIQQAMGKNQMSWGRDQAQILATTDEQGHFAINQLDEETTYVMSVKAEGYAYAFTGEISAGQKDIQIQLCEPIVIHGKIIGPLNKLPQKDGKPYVPYHCTFTWDNNSYGEFGRPEAFVTVQGDEGFFELTNLWGTSVRVGMDYWKQDIKLNEPLPDETVLDLNDPLTEDGKPYHKRQLVLEFETPQGFPPPTGNIRLNYIDPAYADNTYKGKLVEIIDGKATAEIIAPGKIGYEIADTIGYWFEGVSGLKIDDATEPLVIQVPTVPAGMIFGQVFEEDGTPAGNTMVSCKIINNSPLLDEKMHYSVSDLGKNSSSDSETETKYTAAPLPLGGVYQLVAHRKNTYVVSDPIELTEENPIWEVNLTFPRGVTVSGQVLTPDGMPANGIECHLDFTMAGNHGFGNQGQFTDSQGRFMFEQVNPDADGSYSFYIKTTKDYRPVRMELKDLNIPIEITLEQGSVATGQVVDKTTGWPIPGVEVAAYYYDYRDGNNEYERIEAESKTDQHGEFRFSNMTADREYNLILAECRQSGPRATIRAGQTDNVYEVSLPDWSELKPRQPEDF